MNLKLLFICLSIFLSINCIAINNRYIIFKNSNNKNDDTLVKKGIATNDYIHFYQKYISGIRGQECPMYPSCSNFGLKSFNEFNFSKAMLLTSDRVLRCGHDHKNYALTLRPNGLKLIDFPKNKNIPKELYLTINSNYFSYSNNYKDDSSLLFVKKLINNNYYQEALLEIMRLEFNSYFNIELFVNKIICLNATQNYENAIFEYETKCPLVHKYNSELIYYVSFAYHKLYEYKKSNEILKNTTSNNDSFFEAKKMLLAGLNYASLFEWEKAYYTYNSFNYSIYKDKAISNSLVINKAFEFKDKKPIIAGMLSIIPGLGYVYTKHSQTAISAFIINGLLAYATYSNFKKENYGMGVLTGVFNLSFYLANIYGSSKSAKRYNEQYKRNLINKLKQNSNL